MADQKISELTALSALPATDDYFVLLDTDANTTKKLAANYIYHDWASHTATVTASSGSFTTVSGMNRYFTLHGKTRVLSGLVYITDKGTAADTLRVTIPSGAAANTVGGGSWTGSGYSSGVAAVVILNPSNAYIEITAYDGTTVIGDGKTIGYHIIYELA